MKSIYCCECGHDAEDGIVNHILREHKMSVQDYLSLYPSAPVISEELIRSHPVELLRPKEHDFEPMRKRAVHKIGEWELRGFAEPNNLVPKIDEHFYFPAETGDLIDALNNNERCLLLGPTGCGKSETVLQVCARGNLPVKRLNLTGDTTVADLVGKYVVKGKEMVFEYGILSQSIKDGTILLIDELSSGLPAILFALQAVLEPGGKLTLVEKDGEVITPHPDFRIMATSNNIKGEDSGLYTATNVLNSAFLDRFNCILKFDYLPFDEEVKILLNKTPGLDPVISAGLCKVAEDIRRASQEETIYTTGLSTRRLLNWASKYVATGDIHRSAEITFLNSQTAEDSSVIREICQRYFG